MILYIIGSQITLSWFKDGFKKSVVIRLLSFQSLYHVVESIYPVSAGTSNNNLIHIHIILKHGVILQLKLRSIFQINHRSLVDHYKNKFCRGNANRPGFVCHRNFYGTKAPTDGSNSLRWKYVLF